MRHKVTTVVRKIKIDAMLVKAFDLGRAIAAGGFDHPQHSPVLIAEQRIRVLDLSAAVRTDTGLAVAVGVVCRRWMSGSGLRSVAGRGVADYSGRGRRLTGDARTPRREVGASLRDLTVWERTLPWAPLSMLTVCAVLKRAAGFWLARCVGGGCGVAC